MDILSDEKISKEDLRSEVTVMETEKTLKEKSNEMETDSRKVANKVSFVTFMGNLVLSLVKLFAGIVANSNAMISDAIHSTSDIFSTYCGNYLNHK